VIIFPVTIVKKHNMNIILVKNNEKAFIVVSIFFVRRKIRMKSREKTVLTIRSNDITGAYFLIFDLIMR
jgi:hypothetical protein